MNLVLRRFTYNVTKLDSINSNVKNNLHFDICSRFKTKIASKSRSIIMSLQNNIGQEFMYDPFSDENLLINKDQLSKLEADYEKSRSTKSSSWLCFKETCYIYLYRGGGEPNARIASFDLDGTIIKPKNPRHRIPKGATDWQFFSAWTKTKIQAALENPSRRFVIFTNQNGVGLNIVPLEEIQQRIEYVSKSLDIPLTVFVAINKDIFRKPCLGMFKLFEKSFNSFLDIDKENSFYCGDAVGYPSHSDADIKFAESNNLPFITPEKFVRGHAPKLVSNQIGDAD